MYILLRMILLEGFFNWQMLICSSEWSFFFFSFDLVSVVAGPLFSFFFFFSFWISTFLYFVLKPYWFESWVPAIRKYLSGSGWIFYILLTKYKAGRVSKMQLKNKQYKSCKIIQIFMYLAYLFGRAFANP